MYFGKLHLVTLVQCFSWIAFVLLAGGKIGVAVSKGGLGGGAGAYGSGDIDGVVTGSLSDGELGDVAGSHNGLTGGLGGAKNLKGGMMGGAAKGRGQGAVGYFGSFMGRNEEKDGLMGEDDGMDIL